MICDTITVICDMIASNYLEVKLMGLFLKSLGAIMSKRGVLQYISLRMEIPLVTKNLVPKTLMTAESFGARDAPGPTLCLVFRELPAEISF